MASDHFTATGMPGRYALALFQIAEDAGQIDQVQNNLNNFKIMLKDSPDLARLVRSPVFSADEQTKALLAILKKSGGLDIVRNFFALVVKNRRLFALSDMIDCYNALVAQHRGEVNAYVTSATELSDQQLSDLKTSLRFFAKSEIKVYTDVDPNLLGGLIVKIGSRMIDTSLRTKLNGLKIAMREVG